MGWLWDSSARQYTDDATGDVISRDEMKQLQADLVTKLGDQFRATASDLYNRGASPDEWEQALRPLVDRTQAIGYQLARGGSAAMSDGDWQTVATQIEQAYGFLNTFAADAGTGQLGEDEIATRAGLYADGARGGFGAGTAAAWGISFPVDIPIHPNCSCDFRVEQEDGGINAYFETGANPCPECVGYAEQYNPYVAA